jgi:hypothetical protein
MSALAVIGAIALFVLVGMARGDAKYEAETGIPVKDVHMPGWVRHVVEDRDSVLERRWN